MKTISTPFGKAAEVSTDIFIKELLPPLQSRIQLDALLADVDLAKDASRRPKLPVTKNGRLWGYALKTPSKLKGRKVSAFKGLQICVGKLTKAVGPLESFLEFRNNEKAQWALRNRTDDSLPDAYFLPRSRRDGRVDWTTIVVPGVYNKVKTQTTSGDNITKITRCMSQCLYRDARRRYVYGFTVEDSTMRLWYCDRAQIIASSAFDFVTEWEPLLRFWLCILYADPPNLGFDPTVRLLEDDAKEACYEIEVWSSADNSQVYHTLAPLSNTDRDILGRGTRVWKAVKIEDGKEVGEPVALKDSWVRDGRQREGHMDTSIRESSASNEDRKALERSFLTVLAHGDVLIDGTADRTKTVSTLGNAGDKDAVGSHENLISSHHERRQVHYRIVYKEVCEPLHSVSSLFKIFKALGDACHGLKVLHKCGWVHRDISVGNLLLFDNFTKIADLEYAERVDEVAKHPHAIVGTHGFVAAEVQLGRYIFLARRQRKRRKIEFPLDFDEAAFYEENSARLARNETPLSFPVPVPSRHNSPKPKTPDFHYNALHDLESLWWIAAYFLITYEVATDKELGEEAIHRRDSQCKVARNLFWDGATRYNAIEGGVYFETQLECLHPSLEGVGSHVEDARAYLVTGYTEAERDLLAEGLNLEGSGSVHAGFIDCFYATAKLLKEHDVLVRPLDTTIGYRRRAYFLRRSHK